MSTATISEDPRQSTGEAFSDLPKQHYSFKKIAILGCGGIGGSIVLTALAKPEGCTKSIFNGEYAASVFHGTQFVVYDIDPMAKTRLLGSPSFQKLREQGRLTQEIIDQRVIFTTDPSAVSGAELINFAIPVDQYDSTARKICPYIDPKTTVITDEGSVKEAAIERAIAAFGEYFGDNLPPFVGYHIPFHDYPTEIGFLIRTDYSTAHAVDMVERFRRGLGARKFFRVTAREHDTLYGTSSHLNYVNMGTFLRTQFMHNAIGSGAQNADPGSWIQAMISITKTSPCIWPGIFMDNKIGLLDSARQLRAFLEKHASLLMTPGLLDEAIDKLHLYAKDKPSELMSPFEVNDPHSDLRISGFAAFFSAAVTANVQRVEEATRVTIADYANPSCRQGVGIVACDPCTAKQLLHKYADEIPAMLSDFLGQFDLAQQMIDQGDYDTLLAFSHQTCAQECLVRENLARSHIQCALPAVNGLQASVLG